MKNRPFPILGTRLRQDFDTYLDDEWLAVDTIRGFTADEARQLLMDLWEMAPHCSAKALALRWPLSAERWDEVEAFVQESLPLSE